ncbi:MULTISPECIES: hypothetical protein [Streptomyces]|uniref:Uncharacterized protein n=1 Tax=Streptomyces tsukubensis (strain DSM 42081 / NBRC 108919 / NRRL 18488 / 9993) TaxID=1114943 RepID=I2N0B9_STRT9|nr:MULTISPECIES: hypothetical protein [Streptomyces]AZK94681.1 hypothetical protein B7R87_13005 [Streptomyces tsukubensis]EIF90466.1 hypothetical protein [Streptomyces tsukubensis NRRL18488]MYS63873.1 hypothetical protein [Streptomyces sp. SID5473]QKM69235.1 hypothetical protein STSU_020765 [Streptomyces tsukubensis NRRL18488]TAI42834.1 hypothetical protein EWI31_20770 [Streptomyces tsukubensis]
MRTKWKKAATVLAASACAVTMTAGLTASTAVAEEEKPGYAKEYEPARAKSAYSYVELEGKQLAEARARNADASGRAVVPGVNGMCKVPKPAKKVAVANGAPWQEFKDGRWGRMLDAERDKAQTKWIRKAVAGGQKQAILVMTWEGPKLRAETIRNVAASYDGGRTWKRLAVRGGESEARIPAGAKAAGAPQASGVQGYDCVTAVLGQVWAEKK